MEEISASTSIKPCALGQGQKKLQRPNNSKRNRLKNARYAPNQLPEFPKCGHKGKTGQPYLCSTLSMKDIKKFHERLYSTVNKVEQDMFFLKCCEGKLPKRVKDKKKQKHRVSIVYRIYVEGGQYVRVCKYAFLTITNLSRDRIERVVTNFLLQGNTPKERRGGDRVGNKNDERKIALKNFMESLNCVESHYCCSKTTERLYLPCELNFAKLWGMYNSSVPQHLQVKLSYHRSFVNINYNIAFGTPKTDVCSTCLRSEEQLRNENLPEAEKNKLIAQQKIHTLKAQAFFSWLKEKTSYVEIFSFDCQKNLALPKLPDQACYFSQQFNYYNFTIVNGTSKDKLQPSNVFSYVWADVDAPKDSNSISSAVHHLLTNYSFTEDIDTVRLFADGCGGQNKNINIMTMISSWLAKDAPKNISTVEFLFPIVGHSFLPPDRAFGLIEKDIKKKSVIVNREDYDEVIQKHSTIRKIGEWKLYDWKNEARVHVKQAGSWHFQFNKSKRFIFTRNGNGNVLIRGEPNYNMDVGVAKGILKRGSRFSHISPAILQIGRQLKGDKKSIASLLTSHYGETWIDKPELQFYKNNLFPEIPQDIQETENHNSTLEERCNNPLQYIDDELPV